MREYGQVQCSFWAYAAERGWSSDAKLLGCYILTGPHSNGIGCYRLSDGYIADDLGWESERVRETLSELFRHGFCERFGTVLFIPGFLDWNAIANPNVAKARAAEFETIPNADAKRAAARALLEFGSHWDNGFRSRLETLSKGYAEQKPTQTNPTQTNESPDGDSSPPSASPTAADEWVDGGGGEQGDSAAPGVPPCPVNRIIDAYHAELPQLPQVRAFPDAARTHLRTRWREDADRQDVEWWRGFFRHVAKCPFLVGQKTDFTASLDWLVKPSNFAKVVNGNYDP